MLVLGAALALGTGVVVKAAPHAELVPAAMFVASASSFVLGGIALVVVPTVLQPGTTQERIPPQGASAGASLGLRF